MSYAKVKDRHRATALTVPVSVIASGRLPGPHPQEDHHGDQRVLLLQVHQAELVDFRVHDRGHLRPF